VISNWDVVEPDLLLVCGDQLGILTEKNVMGTPALVVEILSPSTRKRDLTLKRRLFERSGVREYWLVDPDRRLVRVFRRDAAGAFPTGGEFLASEHAMLATPILPGWSLAMDQLFA
jgi:Uma2 family endonuclease